MQGRRMTHGICGNWQAYTQSPSTSEISTHQHGIVNMRHILTDTHYSMGIDLCAAFTQTGLGVFSHANRTVRLYQLTLLSLDLLQSMAKNPCLECLQQFM